MTMTETHLDPTKRHDFVLLFDVTDGNPNGDPDAGNLPRLDPETMHGLVTDVAIKRKVRDYILLTRNDKAPFRIYVQNSGVALNTLHEEGYEAKKIKPVGTSQKREDIEKVREWMCGKFADIRFFGAVMTTGVNAGQVRGPVQLTFARSVEPIVPLDLSITRVAVTRADQAAPAKEGEESQEGKGKRSEMGRKSIVPYGLYRAHGFINPHFAKDTGMTKDDLGLFWEALLRMWDHDRSAARGMMACRGLFVFTHDDPLGNAPAHKLLESVKVTPRSAGKPARGFTDYEVGVEKGMPKGITLTTPSWG
jgi:CRISPR-associated protein Csd2